MTKEVKLTDTYVINMRSFLKKANISQDYLFYYIIRPRLFEGESYKNTEVLDDANNAKIYDSYDNQIQGTSFSDRGGKLYCLNENDTITLPSAVVDKLINQNIAEEIS